MSAPRIIFLDFDGVLNSQLWYRSRTKPRQVGETDLSPELVRLLNGLIADTRARVVVTSTWRIGRSVEELQAILETVGFDGEVIGKTVDAREGRYGNCVLRGNEVLHWMKDHQDDVLGCSHSDFKSYVILDDDSDFLLGQKDNFQHVDPYCGLTPTTVYKAARILGCTQPLNRREEV